MWPFSAITSSTKLRRPIASEAIGRATVLLRSLRQDREERHLVQLEVADVLVEIGAARRLHTEAAPAERDLIEVELHDLALGQHALDPPREDHLLELAGDRVLIAEQDVLGDLLGDRRAANRAAARAELAGVVEHRVEGAGDVDATMGPEGLVLGRSVGVDQLRREILVLQLHAPLAGVGMDDLAIDPPHHGGQRRLVLQQRLGIGQVAREQQPDEQPQQGEAEKRDRSPAKPALVAPVLAIPRNHSRALRGGCGR
jgi:hypothetical protein